LTVPSNSSTKKAYVTRDKAKRKPRPSDKQIFHILAAKAVAVKKRECLHNAVRTSMKNV
jgi:hypothetical protein